MSTHSLGFISLCDIVYMVCLTIGCFVNLDCLCEKIKGDFRQLEHVWYATIDLVMECLFFWNRYSIVWLNFYYME